MAISKWFYMDQAGATQLATDIFTKVNTRIAQRITNGAVTSADFSDESHVFSSKRLLDMIGDLANYASLDGAGNTVLDKTKAVDLRVGQSTDNESAATVYGEIARVKALVSNLTHLTYQVVEGDIETEVPTSEARTDVIYLQHDEPSIWVANDGYVMHDASTRASALEQDGETVYYAYYDAAQSKYLKSDGTTVSSTELTSEDAIFDSENNPNAAARIADNTYNLYIAVPTDYLKDSNNFLVKADGTTICSYTYGGETYYAYWDSSESKWYKSTSSSSYVPTSPATELSTSDPVFAQAGFVDIDWICVGDTSIELDNYWSKTDADVSNLRDLMFDEIPTATVSSIVQTAFDNTDPFPVTP